MVCIFNLIPHPLRSDTPLGTGIQLLGNATQANYSILLDGAPYSYTPHPEKDILVLIQDLNDTNHTVSLEAIVPDFQDPPASSILFFDQALVISAPPPDAPVK